MNKTERKTALRILKGFEEIVENEMLTHGTYASAEGFFHNEELAQSGALCGGNSMCAVGSIAWSAAIVGGTSPLDRKLPSQIVDECEDRADWEGPKAEVLELMNELALEYINSRRWLDEDDEMRDGNEVSIEAQHVEVGELEYLFEELLSLEVPYDSSRGRRAASFEARAVMLGLIRIARRRIKDSK